MAEHPLAHYRELDPEAVDQIQQMNAFALSDGELPRKVKILIAMALDASHGAVNGVKSLAMQALAEGATKGEIAETLRVACYVSGAGSVYTAAAALRELDL
ncbi:MAG TPA: carboxymuconolactone decarboxylase family protein [Candidatus Lokiarchaeia archaeon]|nr:carboxymuconolactone decarboxylase family protein [Candidatus Lokiarchaeia archaeon]